MNTVSRGQMGRLPLSEGYRLLSVGCNNQRALKDVNKLIPIVGMPCPFCSRLQFCDVDNRFFACNFSNIDPYELRTRDRLFLSK